jgi:hypothetical protein
VPTLVPTSEIATSGNSGAWVEGCSPSHAPSRSIFIGIDWNHRAANTCNEETQKPRGADARGYSIRWEWTEFAYVCTYDAPVAVKRRVGFTEAYP